MKILKTIFVASFFLTTSFTDKDTRIPPSITRGPSRNFIYRTGESVTLDCKGKGIPAVTYEWRKNGFILNQNLRNIQRGADGTITIQHATSRDEGFYQCLVRNRYGTALSITAHVQLAFLDSTSGTSAVLTQYVMDGQPFHIQCDRLRSFPKPTYIWEVTKGTEDKNPIQLVPSARVQIAENGDLHFNIGRLNTIEYTGKIYRCSTYNPYLGVKEGGNYTELLKTNRRRRQSAETNGFFSESPTVAVIGGSVTLRCFIYRNLVPKYSWSRPGTGNTLPTGRYRLDSFNTSLTIDNITASDEGDYDSNVSSPNENFRAARFLVRVEAVPLFPTVNDAPFDVNVTEGASLTFRCYSLANPEAKIVWLQDGKVLDPNHPPVRFEFSNRNRSLTIRDICRDCVNQDRETDLMVIQCNASNVHGYAFAQGYLNVLNTYCDDELDKEHSILWSRTMAGQEISRPCPGNTTGSCSRKCLLSSDGIAFWSKTNYNGCFDKEFKDLLDKVNAFETTALTNQKIAGQLLTLTDKSEALSPGNLNASVMILNRLAALRSGSTNSPNETEIKSIVQATSSVLQPNNSKSWKELKAVNETVATAILSSVDIYGRSLSTSIKSEHSREHADNMVLEAWSLKKSNLPLELEFPSRSVWDETGGDKISISMESLENSISSESRPTWNIWGSYYRTINDYLPGNEDTDFINSKVLSFSIDGLKTKEKLKRPVLITLQHNQEEGMRFRRTCAFWNFDRGEWDSKGCSVTSTNSTHTICSCDHLTNFAILMSRNPSYDKALSLISIIGCSISVAALILTIIVYALTWKQSKSAQATVLLNLCVALIIGYIVFMTGADKVDAKDGCTAVAVLLHYFFLAAFFIMLAEGVELLVYIIFVFHVRRTRETIMLIAAAWVLPLIIVVVSLGSTKVEGYGSSHACWLSAKNGLIWAFVAPVLCIITVNFVILIIVLRLMSRKRSFIANNTKKRDEIRATLWNLSVTCPVLGLGWLFGIFAFAFDNVIFQYLFVVANSLQGLLVFIFHALFHNKKMNEKISFVYSNYICRCRKTDISVSTQMTSAPQQSTSSGAAYKKTGDAVYVPKVVKYYEEIESQDDSHSTGTQHTGIDDSDTMESTH